MKALEKISTVEQMRPACGIDFVSLIDEEDNSLTSYNSQMNARKKLCIGVTTASSSYVMNIILICMHSLCSNIIK
jgi:hypothetical protein